MHKTLLHCALLLVISLSQLACSSTPAPNKLTIATAANMHFAMTSLIEQFSANTGIACDLVVSSSGKLTAQIKEGAPYDILVSADMKYPEEIYRSGRSETTPKVYAYGKLVLWTMDKNIAPSLEVLTDASIQHIALANPKTAPYGTAAVALLKQNGLYDQITSKLVFGESIAQTNQFITSGAAEIGFTAMSVVLSPEMKDQGQWLAMDENTYQPIEQGIVVIKQENSDPEAALAFYHYIFSAEAKKILLKFGYSVDE
jgi:molybdate transport system substrate-binding protein